MSRSPRIRLLAFALDALIFAADQAIKWVVDYPLNMRKGETIDWLPIFAFTRTHNYGVSLGMFTATSPEMRWGLVAVTGLSGQISLTQYLFLGIGAFVAGRFFGGDSVFGMLLGGVVAAVLTGRSDRNVLVHLPGGDLNIEWRQADNNVYMTGPATEVFSGEWNG